MFLLTGRTWVSQQRKDVIISYLVISVNVKLIQDEKNPSCRPRKQHQQNWDCPRKSRAATLVFKKFRAEIPSLACMH